MIRYYIYNPLYIIYIYIQYTHDIPTFLGIPRDPFQLYQCYSLQDVWSHSKRLYCCWKTKVGCPHSHTAPWPFFMSVFASQNDHQTIGNMTIHQHEHDIYIYIYNIHICINININKSGIYGATHFRGLGQWQLWSGGPALEISCRSITPRPSTTPKLCQGRPGIAVDRSWEICVKLSAIRCHLYPYYIYSYVLRYTHLYCIDAVHDAFTSLNMPKICHCLCQVHLPPKIIYKDITIHQKLAIDCNSGSLK